MNGWLPAVVTALAAAVVGIPLSRWLAATTYRKPDELDDPSPGRRWWVPGVLAVAAAAVVHRIWSGDDPAVPGTGVALVLTVTLLVVLVACVALAAMDLDVHRLPDRVMWPTMTVLAVGLCLAALVGGGWEPLLRALLAALAGGLFYLVVALISLARGSLALGLGDVKLAVVLAGSLGWFGWTEAILGVYGGFVVGGLVAVGLLVARRASLRDQFAFGPAMMVGALLGLMIPAIPGL